MPKYAIALTQGPRLEIEADRIRYGAGVIELVKGDDVVSVVPLDRVISILADLSYVSGTPKLAEEILIDFDAQTIKIDGGRFPFYLAEHGPGAITQDDPEGIPYVWLPVLAETIEALERSGHRAELRQMPGRHAGSAETWPHGPADAAPAAGTGKTIFDAGNDFVEKLGGDQTRPAPYPRPFQANVFAANEKSLQDAIAEDAALRDETARQNPAATTPEPIDVNGRGTQSRLTEEPRA